MCPQDGYRVIHVLNGVLRLRLLNHVARGNTLRPGEVSHGLCLDPLVMRGSATHDDPGCDSSPPLADAFQHPLTLLGRRGAVGQRWRAQNQDGVEGFLLRTALRQCPPPAPTQPSASGNQQKQDREREECREGKAAAVWEHGFYRIKTARGAVH